MTQAELLIQIRNLVTKGFENNSFAKSQFYFDNNINIGYGFNISGNPETARIAINAATGWNISEGQWDSDVAPHLSSPSQAGANAINTALGLTITEAQATTLMNNYFSGAVSSGLASDLSQYGVTPSEVPPQVLAGLQDLKYNANSGIYNPLTETSGVPGLATALTNKNWAEAAYRIAFNPGTSLPNRRAAESAIMLGFAPTIESVKVGGQWKLEVTRLDPFAVDLPRLVEYQRLFIAGEHDVSGSVSRTTVQSLVVPYLQAHGFDVPDADDATGGGTTQENILAAIASEAGISTGLLEAINERFSDRSFTVGGVVRVPIDSFDATSFVSLPELPEGQNYLYDPGTSRVYVVGGSTNGQYASGDLISADETSVTGTYATYAAAGLSLDGSDLVVHLAGGNGTVTMSYNTVETVVTFGNSFALAVTPPSNLALEIDPEADTPQEHVLAYLAQLGEELSWQDLVDENHQHFHPDVTPYGATGAVEALSWTEANYRFETTDHPDPGAIIAGEDLVTIQTGVDGLGNPVYGQVTPTNILEAYGDISRDAISDIDVLDVGESLSLTGDQLANFGYIIGSGIGPTGSSMDGTNFIQFYAVGGGTFDASSANIDSGVNLWRIEATDWDGTTLIGSDQDEQILKASLLGDDTLQAGNGQGAILIAGLGVNTLIGGTGEDVFVARNDLGLVREAVSLAAPGDGLAPGSVVDGNGTGNILYARGDISGASISGIQTLDVAGDITLTAAQLASFDTIQGGGGNLYAASEGTYDWSEQATASFAHAYALSSEGTTLIAGDIGFGVLHASESGDDTLVAESGTLDAGNSTGDVTMTVGSGSIYTGFGVNTVTLEDGGVVYVDHALAPGSSIEFEEANGSLVANGDISEATITGAISLAAKPSVTLTAAQLSGLSSITDGIDATHDITLNAASAGTYDLSAKSIGAGIVTLNGSFGADTLTGSTDGDIINGSDGNDTIRGYGGADTLDGGAGDDIIQIFSGEVPSGEVIDGGDGTDRLVVGSNSMGPLATISNMEELYLDTGVTAVSLTAAQLDDFDTITHQSGGSQAFSITAQAAGTFSLAGKTITGILTLNGSSGADTLTGTSGSDILRGMAGADTINAGDGNDNIIIASGEVASGDSIDGGNGTDRLTVNNSGMNPSAMTVSNMEELYLSSGVTAITLGAAQLADFETITQASSASFSITAAAAGTYSLAGKTITGTATLNGTSGADTLTGSSSADTINGNAGNDFIEGGAGNDTLNGGNDTDTLTYANAGSAVTVDLSNGSAQNTGGAGTDTISNFENLTGSAYNDTLTGTSSANVILGGDGNDTISGGAGNDTIDGGIGANTLTGGTGNDTYVLARTYETSEIVENDSTGGNTDVLQLGADIAIDQMWFRQSGNDLLVDVIGTGAQMRIADWYSGSDYQIEEIVTEEEDVLDHTNVQNLVNAMSGLSMPETTTLSPGYHTELDTVIAANWA